MSGNAYSRTLLIMAAWTSPALGPGAFRPISRGNLVPQAFLARHGQAHSCRKVALWPFPGKEVLSCPPRQAGGYQSADSRPALVRRIHLGMGFVQELGELIAVRLNQTLDRQAARSALPGAVRRPGVTRPL